MADYRVGINQFLILGALVQAPGGGLSAAQLQRHFKSHKRYYSVVPIINGLIHRGCIRWPGDPKGYVITEYGGEAKCQRSRNERQLFLPLDNIPVEIERFGG